VNWTVLALPSSGTDTSIIAGPAVTPNWMLARARPAASVVSTALTLML
jgi:hypothetical protein